MVNYLAQAGGLFAIMTFIHFFIDWICQTHSEAMQKHNNPRVRARHCFIYMCGFVPFLLVVKLTWFEFFVSMNILFWSHFVEDTYLPVYLWAKYVRRPPEMTEPRKSEPYIFIDLENKDPMKKNEVRYDVLPPDPKKGFLEFISTPLGKILMIAVDQIIHLTFLFPIIYFILN